jgi:phosphodiesterase/alkaline phosphatase D-like protein
VQHFRQIRFGQGILLSLWSNPWPNKFFNNQRGYVRHVVTPDRWQADFQVLDKASVRDGHVSTRKSCVVEDGQRGLVDA